MRVAELVCLRDRSTPWRRRMKDGLGWNETGESACCTGRDRRQIRREGAPSTHLTMVAQARVRRPFPNVRLCEVALEPFFGLTLAIGKD